MMYLPFPLQFLQQQTVMFKAMQDQTLALQQSQAQLICQLADQQRATTALSVAAPSPITSNEVE